MLVPGQVGEITVIPGEFVQPQEQDSNEIFHNGDRPGNGDPNEIGTTEAIEYVECVVAIAAERNGVRRETLLSLNVYPEEDLLEPVASEYRDSFIPYLASKYPELGITEDEAVEDFEAEKHAMRRERRAAGK